MILRKKMFEYVKQTFTDIKDVNTILLSQGISLALVSIEKNRKNQVKELTKQIFDTALFKNVKVVLFLEHTIDITDIADAVWRFSNNVDPKRDHFIIETQNNTTHIAFDGTRKTKEHDGFERDWPNILASTVETIEHIDSIWDKLGLGNFYPFKIQKAAV